jgi:hypothetical protein
VHPEAKLPFIIRAQVHRNLSIEVFDVVAGSRVVCYCVLLTLSFSNSYEGNQLCTRVF